MKNISFVFLLLILFLSGCGTRTVEQNSKPISDRILKVNSHYIDEVSISSIKEITKESNNKEAYQECYTKKYDKNQNEASLITSFFNTSKDSHIASIEFCETKYRDKKVSRLINYLVEYEYKGNTFTYITKKKPNLKDKIAVEVIVVPVK